MSRLLGLVMVLTIGAAPMTARAPTERPHPAPRLIESADCRHRSDRRTPAAGDVALVTVIVPPTAILRIDARGAVVAALTNTGCAPRDGDAVYVMRAGGGLTPASGTALEGVRWTGDFTQVGSFQQQRG